jgi:hypothetical protein
VAFIYAHFSVAISLARRAPLQGFARWLQTSQYEKQKKKGLCSVIFYISPNQFGAFAANGYYQ